MKQPGLDLGGMVIETRKKVMQASGNKQVPYDYGTLTRRYCLAGCEIASSTVNDVKPIVSVPQASKPTSDDNLHAHGSRSHSHALPAAGKNHLHGGGAKPKPKPSFAANPSVTRPVVGRTSTPNKMRLPEMVFVKGGTFMMGSPPAEAPGWREAYEAQHEVQVGNFYIGKTEVTNAEYTQCVKAGKCKPSEESFYNSKTKKMEKYERRFRGSQQPVVGVSWHNAMSYAGWLSTITGQSYSLPTEAQWEYAARAGTKTAYYWGDQIEKNHANCKGCGSLWDDKNTAPVASFSPNNFGVYDMLGNVEEWTCSEFSQHNGGNRYERCAALSSNINRARRGGSWESLPVHIRSADRRHWFPSGSFGDLGFRIARNP